MKIKLRTYLVGFNYSRNSGEIITVSQEEGIRFLNNGLADFVSDDEPNETATAPLQTVETATVKGKSTPKQTPKK